MSDNILQVPICVDLDNTFILTDVFEEGLLKLLITKPLRFIEALFIMCVYGLARAKQYVSYHAKLNVKDLPINLELLEELKKERKQGRKIYLVTAADSSVAQEFVSVYKDVFDGFFASDGKINLKGQNKAELLVKNFGLKGFVYVGDSRADFAVWAHSQQVWVVCKSQRFFKQVSKKYHISKCFYVTPVTLKTLFKQIRVIQWVKNILVFVPIILAHDIFNLILLFKSALAFVALSFCSSSVYVLNDLFDLQADRSHPEKKNRPLASGVISIKLGIFLFVVLFSLSMIFAFSKWIFYANRWLFYYFILTQLYSLKLKKVPILDVVILGMLFTMRIIYGGFVTHTPPSSWLMSLSFFVFVNLGFLKRATEISLLADDESMQKTTRGYVKDDLDLIKILGISCSMISVLIYVLYINSDKVSVLYKKPDLLWLICPLLVYWLGRLWFLVQRQQMLYDPVMFTVKDRTSYTILLLCVLVLIKATVG